MAWSRGQQIALAMIPKFSSVLSLLGSSWVVVEVLTHSGDSPKKKHPYHRLLFAMSVYDIMESLWNFTSTWPIPASTEDVFRPLGTTKTCTAQGFFLTLSVAVPIYNAMLSLYYLLVICYGYTDKGIKVWIEPMMHTIAFCFAFGTASTSAFMGLINNANLWCWIAPYPGDCLDSRRYPYEANCERGDNAWIYRWAFYFAPLWFCILFATLDRRAFLYRAPHNSKGSSSITPSGEIVASYRIGDDTTNGEDEEEHDKEGSSNGSNGTESLPVVKEMTKEERQFVQDKKDDERLVLRVREQFGESETENYERSLFDRWKNRRADFAKDFPRTIEVFYQAVWYLGTFYITHVWSTSNRIIQQLNNGKTLYPIIVLHSWFDPLQGFLNYFVYQRPRYLKVRRDSPEVGRLGAAYRALRFSFMAPIDPSPAPSSMSAKDLTEAERIETFGPYAKEMYALDRVEEVDEAEDESDRNMKR